MIDPVVLERFRSELLSRSPWVSLYLDLDGGNPLARTYRRKLKELSRELSGRSENGVAGTVAAMQTLIDGLDRAGAKGIAVFGSPGLPETFAFRLPVRVADRLVAGDHPALFPFVPMVDTARRLLLVVAGKGKARLYRSFLGRLSEGSAIEEDLPSKVREGGWRGYSEKKIDRHVEDHVRRFAGRIAEEASAEVRREAPAWIVLMGSRDLFPLLKEKLAPLVPEGRIITHPSQIEPSREELISLLPLVEEGIHIVEERALSGRLRDLAASGKAVLGPEASLQAVVSGQADLLAVTRGLPHAGLRCAACGYLGTGGASCPRCGEGLTDGDLADEAVYASVAKGCRTFLADDGALPEGMAAILRFPV